jgi:hypothetical protein
VFSVAKIRALVGGGHPSVSEPLLALVDAHLIMPLTTGWYQIDNLVRLFASERLRADEPTDARQLTPGALIRPRVRLPT